MTNKQPMPEISCFLSARRHLREGRPVRALLIISDLLQSEFGRPLAHQLLAEMYPGTCWPNATTESPDVLPSESTNPPAEATDS
jgi:hypothetical protein